MLSDVISEDLVICKFLPLFHRDLDILCLPAVGIVRVGLNELLSRTDATFRERP